MKTLIRGWLLFMAFICLIMAGLAARECVRQLSLDHSGIVIEGTAESIQRRGLRKDSLLDYQFVYAGDTYHGSAYIPKGWAKGKHLPTPIQVRLVPWHPDFNIPAAIGQFVTLWLIVPLILVYLTVGILVLTQLRENAVERIVNWNPASGSRARNHKKRRH